MRSVDRKHSNIEGKGGAGEIYTQLDTLKLNHKHFFLFTIFTSEMDYGHMDIYAQTINILNSIQFLEKK